MKVENFLSLPFILRIHSSSSSEYPIPHQNNHRHHCISSIFQYGEISPNISFNSSLYIFDDYSNISLATISINWHHVSYNVHGLILIGSLFMANRFCENDIIHPLGTSGFLFCSHLFET